MAKSDDTLLEFPCAFDVKAFGRHDTDFEQTVYELVKAHAPALTQNDISARSSSGGRYLAVTASIRAESKAQLDAIYQALTDSDQVLMSL
ncbi:YbeD family protein [Salinisphaera sp. Q1T1-3]|uniref:YbeD family protein n=1 Tax=Salinisphaera sp. Q1T1-3 TaxID=2321229 RepID=UPI000E732011|nr:DUF493 domain-containing protein [Salinisphaera sp. Q1T1-3]RJS94639.1 DUF493 domain-containing protein [Salinisphaera sp. Q1T1-3]